MPIFGITEAGGKLSFEDIVFLSILGLGVVLSIIAPSKVMFLLISFLVGGLFGRIWYLTRNSLQFRYFFMIVFFVIGLIIGSLIKRYSSPFLTMLIFCLGIAIGHYLSSREYPVVKIFRKKSHAKKEHVSRSIF